MHRHYAAVPAAVLAVALTLLPAIARAAAWPDNWLGPADQQYRALSIGVYYYGAVLHDISGEGETALPFDSTEQLSALASLPELSPAEQQLEFERVKAEILSGAEFYWRNTRFNCAFDFEWFTDYSPVLRSSISQLDPPYCSPVDHPAYGDARSRYDGLLQVMVLYQWNEEAQQLVRVRGGGGFTWGADSALDLCGWSWWAAPVEHNVCGSDWLFVHEFGHQLDSLFEQSGHPEMWFNHLAPSEGNVARFGEHFDANAYILRRTPEADWHDLKWGELRTFEDADGDDVPDAGEWLTARGYTVDPSSELADTDYDGMTDYAELMASNGITIGHGERLHPALKLQDPSDHDSDSDGVADGEDKYPLHQDLRSAALTTDSGSAEAASEAFSTLTAPAAVDAAANSLSIRIDRIVNDSVVIEMHWDGQMSEGASLKLMLDLDNDGWFTGGDNYALYFDKESLLQVTMHDAGSYTEWPAVRELAPEVQFSSHRMSIDGVPGFRIATVVLSRAQFPALAAKPGEMIGINVGIKPAGENWYYMLGEPNALIPVELR